MTIPLLRKALPVLTIGIVAVSLYDAWVFYIRWRDSRAGERMSQTEEADRARRTIDMLGGGRLKILHFYASPSVIRRGEVANICYGVYGAKSVRIEPYIEELRPAVARCVQVSPSSATVYKLMAEDGQGQTATQDFTLKVIP